MKELSELPDASTIQGVNTLRPLIGREIDDSEPKKDVWICATGSGTPINAQRLIGKVVCDKCADFPLGRGGRVVSVGHVGKDGKFKVVQVGYE